MFSRYLSLALLFAPAAFATVYDIQVGDDNGDLKFTPEAIGAAVGDTVVFHFNPKNHSIVQSSFDNPCGPKDGGIKSDFYPVMANQSAETRPTWSVQINDTNPLWMYCRQGKDTPQFHCGKGMVFAVNCGLDGQPNSFTNFKNAALDVGKKLAAASTTDGGYGSSPTWTAAYGGYSVPPVSDAVVVTQTVTLSDQVWTTTYSSYPGSAAPTPAALQGVEHKVIVGGPSGLLFDPAEVSAAPRDTVIFEIHSKNHSVTQSTFTDPCRKKQDGFDSDLMPVADENGPFQTFSVTVNDTQPIWAYCKQKTPTSHCGAGMVFAINPVDSSERSFNAFKDLATKMNGTAAAAAANPSETSTGNGAANVKANAGLTLLLVAAIASFL
ncbi:hypothetical protein DL96DRAFT_1519823 [Flagelloscypha sp. PMI_526]|nr:hypothetical protein DL96DRAFT_1519823 [Flagelloscypha sp. PMI_526]